MNRVLEWLDNPIFVKHVRSRLRTGQLIPAGAVVLILCLLIGWGGWMLDGYTYGAVFGALMALQTIILVLIGSSQVATSLSGARESGILDFHRVSPLSPLEVTLGFFFGAPIREYALFACTLPFSLFCVAMGAPDFFGMAQILFAMILAAWVFHALALLNALTLKKSRTTSRGVVGVVIFMLIFSTSRALSFGSATALVSASPTLNFFGVALHWLVFVLLYTAPVLIFLLIAATRKMRTDRAHAYSKPQAVACLTTLCVLLLGALWGVPGYGFSALVVLYALVVAAMWLSVTVTPSAGEYVKGMRRAAKLGRKHLRFWDDLALNRPAVAIFCGIVLVGSTAAWRMPEVGQAGMGGDSVSYSVAISVGVFSVAYFGLALQFFFLYFLSRAIGYSLFALFLFVVWLVPLLVGAILMTANMSESAGTIVLALSPLAGIGMSVGVGERRFGQGHQLAALLPAIGFAFLFSNLVALTRRRLNRVILVPTPAKPNSELHPLEAV